MSVRGALDQGPSGGGVSLAGLGHARTHDPLEGLVGGHRSVLRHGRRRTRPHRHVVGRSDGRPVRPEDPDPLYRRIAAPRGGSVWQSGAGARRRQCTTPRNPAPRLNRMVEMGESRTPRPEPFARDHYERVRWFVVNRPGAHRQAPGRSSHVSLDRAWLRLRDACVESHPPLNDASTAREEEAASTLTLPLTQRGRESTGGCQLLRFAACLTRPDGTSARVP